MMSPVAAAKPVPQRRALATALLLNNAHRGVNLPRDADRIVDRPTVDQDDFVDPRRNQRKNVGEVVGLVERRDDDTDAMHEYLREAQREQQMYVRANRRARTAVESEVNY